ncbi:DUF4142 domain-containing protein [Sphingomonadaceae bacterium jetA1]|uniref:DUF4142 domain-containing protein n=1 Tax=Facivitalis istanbulensis TaxID=3075838 RepID=UPI0034849C38
MTFRATILAASALLALSACGRNKDAAQTNMTNDTVSASLPDAVAPTPSAAQSFADTVAASDAFEIETSRLALTNGASAQVKAYARKMIEAHTASTAKLKATTAGMAPVVTPSATLNAEQQQKLDHLKTLNGTAFDKAYIAEQTAGHQQILDVLKAYTATGDAPALKSFATGLTPTVAAHLNMAKGLKA